MPEEWFRSPDWSAEAEAYFEQRLRRARAFNRPQYLRIKALALIAHGGMAEAKGARGLLRRVIKDYPESLDVVMAHEHLGELDAREGDRRAAEAHYREALRIAPERNVYGDAALRLPELLIDAGGDAEREEARVMLDAIPPTELVFSSQRFRYAVARARLAWPGDEAEARRYAEDALREAAREIPDFTRHPSVGLVEADSKVLSEMQQLARA